MNELASFIAFQLEHEQRVRRAEQRARQASDRGPAAARPNTKRSQRRGLSFLIRLRRPRPA